MNRKKHLLEFARTRKFQRDSDNTTKVKTRDFLGAGHFSATRTRHVSRHYFTNARCFGSAWVNDTSSSTFNYVIILHTDTLYNIHYIL